MENRERQSPDFEENDNVIRYGIIEEATNPGNAINEAKIVQGGDCGSLGAKTLYLQNTNFSRPIGVTIEVKWNYQNEQRVENRVYTVYPQQKVMLGCPIPGPTPQRFDYKILAAWYV